MTLACSLRPEGGGRRGGREAEGTDFKTNGEDSCIHIYTHSTVHCTQIQTYTTIILPVVLYGCGTSSLTLREGHRLRTLENSVLRKIFVPKRDGVRGEWRLYDLYLSPNFITVIKSRRMKRAGHVASMRRQKRCIQAFGRETWRKEPLGRPRRRWEDNSEMDLLDVRWGMGLIDLTQVRDRWQAVVNAVMNPLVPYNAGNFLTSWEEGLCFRELIS
jgi:hypothetical protein